MSRNIDEAFHVWANSPGARGGSGNVTFGGGTLWSYSMIIGRHVTGPDGTRGVLITGDGYSVTTAKHISKARGAAWRSFSCPDGFGLTERTTPGDVRDAWATTIEKKSADYVSAKSKPSKAKIARELRRMVEQAAALARHFGLEPFSDVPEDAELAAYVEQRAAAELTRRSQAELARAEAARLDREDARARLARWLRGEGVSTRGFRDLCGGDVMRLSTADEVSEVETSQGAWAPVADVRRAAPLLLRLIARAVETGEGWTPGAFAPRFGHYTVREVRPDGTLIVGCHSFTRAEVERFAAVLGVAPTNDEIPEGAK